MKEGWHSGEYLILFEETESAGISKGYGLQSFLPGYLVVALSDWDDFIVCDQSSKLFRVPTLPLAEKYLSEQIALPSAASLTPDDRFTGKIKWYTNPIVLGGDPSSDANLTWVSIQKHQQLVRWWNEKILEIQQNTAPNPSGPVR